MRTEAQGSTVTEVAMDVIRQWVETAYQTTLATLAADDEAGRRAIKQMRHLHLAQPYIPARRIADHLPESAAWQAGYKVGSLPLEDQGE